MSYSINISGHGAPAKSVADAFRTLVKALDEATPEGQSKCGGSASGSDPEGNTVSISAAQVREEAEASEV